MIVLGFLSFWIGIPTGMEKFQSLQSQGLSWLFLAFSLGAACWTAGLWLRRKDLDMPDEKKLYAYLSDVIPILIAMTSGLLINSFISEPFVRLCVLAGLLFPVFSWNHWRRKKLPA